MTSMQPVGSLDRSSYLGGADIAAILGVSPYKTKLDLYLDKVEGREEITDPAKLKVLERGKRLEPYVLDMLCIEQGVDLIARGNRYKHPQHDFIAAEIDAETSDGRNVEAKTAADFYSRKLWGEAGTDDIPVYYTAQCMHGMMVHPAPSTLLPVMLGIDDFRVYDVKRDDELIETIRQAEVDFWGCIQRREAPEPVNLSDLLRLHPQDSGEIIQATDEIVRKANELRALRRRAKLLDSDIEDLQLEIQMFMRDASVLRFGADVLGSWKTQETDRIDVNRLRAEQPEIAAQFIKTTQTRVFRLK